MKAVTLAPKPILVSAQPMPWTARRWLDYLALTKPRVSVLVLFTVGAGVLLASPAVLFSPVQQTGSGLPLAVLFHAVFGTALVASGASALNQWLERHSDARMRRTLDRPLPAGRLQPREVLALGALLGAAGTVYLLLVLPSPCAALAAACTFVCYVGVYTPLKTRTTLNTLIGAIPGAMPPVIGWVAVTGEVTRGAVILFVILFVWQVPHFLAIAWMYREEYARARLCMLPVVDPDGHATARQMVLYCLALIPVSLGPVLLESAGPVYAGGALLLGLYFLRHALRFQALRSIGQARKVMRVSLVYLPGLLVLLLLDRSVTAMLAPR